MFEWAIKDAATRLFSAFSAAIMLATASSISPLASPLMSLCLLAAASVGSAQLRYMPSSTRSNKETQLQFSP
ncbi:unnamed protein product, partial [Brassica oleracea var. botrytis]